MESGYILPKPDGSFNLSHKAFFSSEPIFANPMLKLLYLLILTLLSISQRALKATGSMTSRSTDELSVLVKYRIVQDVSRRLSVKEALQFPIPQPTQNTTHRTGQFNFNQYNVLENICIQDPHARRLNKTGMPPFYSAVNTHYMYLKDLPEETMVNYVSQTALFLPIFRNCLYNPWHYMYLQNLNEMISLSNAKYDLVYFTPSRSDNESKSNKLISSFDMYEGSMSRCRLWADLFLVHLEAINIRLGSEHVTVVPAPLSLPAQTVCFTRLVMPTWAHAHIDLDVKSFGDFAGLFLAAVHQLLPLPSSIPIASQIQSNIPLRVVFYDRTDAPFRRILNAEEALAWIPDVIKCESKNDILLQKILMKNFELSFSEQVKTMKTTAVFIAPHGAHFSNMIYLPSGAGLMEITPGCSEGSIKRTSRTAGTHAMHSYLRVFGLTYGACAPMFRSSNFSDKLMPHDSTNCNSLRGKPEASACDIILEKDKFIKYLYILFRDMFPCALLA